MQGDIVVGTQQEYPSEGVTEINAFKFKPMPSSKEWNAWNLASKKIVKGGSIKPKDAYEWISAALEADSWESLADNGTFETLNCTFAAALMYIVAGGFKRKLDNLPPPQTINERQIYWMMKQKV